MDDKSGACLTSAQAYVPAISRCAVQESGSDMCLCGWLWGPQILTFEQSARFQTATLTVFPDFNVLAWLLLQGMPSSLPRHLVASRPWEDTSIMDESASTHSGPHDFGRSPQGDGHDRPHAEPLLANSSGPDQLQHDRGVAPHAVCASRHNGDAGQSATCTQPHSMPVYLGGPGPSQAQGPWSNAAQVSC